MGKHHLHGLVSWWQGGRLQMSHWWYPHHIPMVDGEISWNLREPWVASLHVSWHLNQEAQCLVSQVPASAAMTVVFPRFCLGNFHAEACWCLFAKFGHCIAHRICNIYIYTRIVYLKDNLGFAISNVSYNNMGLQEYQWSYFTSTGHIFLLLLI